MLIIDFILKVFRSSFSILNSASVWLVISFVFAGIFREIISPEKLQKSLGNTKISSIIKSTLSGMLLPICSCGVIPIGFSLYYSGAYLGPTLAFMTSTPIINPIAIVLSYGLLGKEITCIYLIAGFVVPLIVGIIGNKFSKDELVAPGISDINLIDDLVEKDNRTIKEKIISGLKWSVSDISLVISKYVVLGMFLAGFLINVFPQSFIEVYLGNPSMMSLGAITLLAAIMYVCAVGHIPFIAALIATGASPGVAITFLMAGAGTNLPELISMSKIIGKRSVLIYSTTLVSMSILFGYITNLILLANFTPVIDFNRTTNTIEIANTLLLGTPLSLKYVCSFIVCLLAIKSIIPKMRELFASEKDIELY